MKRYFQGNENLDRNISELNIITATFCLRV